MKKTFISSTVALVVLFVFAGSTAFAQNQQTTIQPTSKFQLDFKVENRVVPTGTWWSISGGDPNIEVVDKTHGEDPHEQKRPGQIYFSDITVKGPFVKDRKAVMDWINDAAAGKCGRRNMILSFLNDEGQPKTTYTLFQSLPISYQPPAVSAGNYDMLEESLTFHVEKIKIEKSKNGESSNTNQNPSDEALFGGKFQVNIGEEDVPTTSFSGGGVTFDKKEVTGGERTGSLRKCAITKVNWANIVIEKNVVQGDDKWKNWFEDQRKGQVDYKNITLEYKDSEGKAERSIDFKNTWPIRYDVVNVDSRSGSASSKEILELVVGHATYK